MSEHQFGATIEGMPPPGDPSGQTVQPLTAHTKPLPTKIVAEKYYFSSARNTSLYRKDGTRLIFSQGIFVSRIDQDHKYLDEEIDLGNPYVRLATEDEIHAHKMRVNPKGTIRAEVTAELEATMREKLEKDIIQQLREQGIQITDEFKLKGTDASSNLFSQLEKGVRSGSGTLIPSQTLQQGSIQGTDKIAGMAEGSASGGQQ